MIHFLDVEKAGNPNRDKATGQYTSSGGKIPPVQSNKDFVSSMKPFYEKKGFSVEHKFTDVSKLKPSQVVTTMETVGGYEKKIRAGEPINPIIALNNGEILDGHHRFQAFKNTGIKSIPTLTLTPPTPAQDNARQYGGGKTPAQKLNMEVIGTIKVKDVFDPNKITGTEEVLLQDKNTGTYVVNKWHKLNVPQLVPTAFVAEFKPVKKACVASHDGTYISKADHPNRKHDPATGKYVASTTTPKVETQSQHMRNVLDKLGFDMKDVKVRTGMMPKRGFTKTRIRFNSQSAKEMADLHADIIAKNEFKIHISYLDDKVSHISCESSDSVTHGEVWRSKYYRNKPHNINTDTTYYRVKTHWADQYKPEASER